MLKALINYNIFNEWLFKIVLYYIVTSLGHSMNCLQPSDIFIFYLMNYMYLTNTDDQPSAI